MSSNDETLRKMAESMPQSFWDNLITRCPICGVWDGKGSKHADDCPNG